MGSIVLTLVSRRDCHLCEDMAAVAEGVARARGAELRHLDVDADQELRERFGEEVPVLLVNGRKAFKYRVTESELRRRLDGERRRRRVARLARKLPFLR